MLLKEFMSTDDNDDLFYEIMQAEIVGNAHHDRPLMDKIHEYVLDDTRPMDRRIKVLQKLDKVMGLDHGPITAADVEAYVADHE